MTQALPGSSTKAHPPSPTPCPPTPSPSSTPVCSSTSTPPPAYCATTSTPDLAGFGIPPDYRAADPGSALGAQHLYMRTLEIQLLAAHHDNEQHWLLLAEPEPFGHPGDNELLALHITLEHTAKTFATLGSWHATIAFALLCTSLGRIRLLPSIVVRDLVFRDLDSAAAWLDDHPQPATPLPPPRPRRPQATPGTPHAPAPGTASTARGR